MNNILTAKNPIEKRSEKLTFNTIWQKYGTIGILVILLGILAAAKPNVFFSRKYCSADTCSKLC